MSILFSSKDVRSSTIFQRLFILRILDLGLHDDPGICCLAELRHRIVSSETTLTVGGDDVPVGQIYHEAQHEAVIVHFRKSVAPQQKSGLIFFEKNYWKNM